MSSHNQRRCANSRYCCFAVTAAQNEVVRWSRFSTSCPLMCWSAEFAQPSVCVFPQQGLFLKLPPQNQPTDKLLVVSAGSLCNNTSSRICKSGCSAALLAGWNTAVCGPLDECEVGLDSLAAATRQCRRSLRFENDERRARRPIKLRTFEEAAVAPLLGNAATLAVFHCEMEVHDSNSWLVTPAPAIPLVLCCKRGQFVHFIKERVFS